MPGLNALVDKVRAKYPGAYDDMDDAQLTKAVLAKYPQYSDLAAPGVPSAIPPKGQLPGNPSVPFTERAANRFEQNFQGAAELLDKAPDAISRAIENAGKRRPLSEASKAMLFPFGDSRAAKVAGVATLPHRVTYQMLKGLAEQWYQDPANAVGDFATAALPLGDVKVPGNRRFAPVAEVATESATPTVGKLLRQELVSRLPLAKRLGAKGITLDDLIDLFKKQPEAPQNPWANVPIDPAANLTPVQAWWKRQGRTLVADRPPDQPIRRMSVRYQGPSVPAPPSRSNVSRLSDMMDDMAVKQQMEASMSRDARAAQQAYRAANTVDIPKGVMAERLKAQLEQENMLRGAAPAEQPLPNMVPQGQRASDIITKEEIAATAKRVEGRGAQKAAIEKGVPDTMTKVGAAADNAELAKVRAEHPDWNISQQLQEAAKRMQAKRAPTGTVKYTTTPPSPAKQNLNDPKILKELLDKSLAQAKAKKPRSKQ